MLNFALVQNGAVANIFNCADEETATGLYPDDTVVDVSEVLVQRGWLYDGVNFSQPPLPEQTPAELAAANMATAASEYERATVAIGSLNEQIEDADYDGSTEEAVKAELASWTDYRKQLRAYIKAGDGSQQLPPAPKNIA